MELHLVPPLSQKPNRCPYPLNAVPLAPEMAPPPPAPPTSSHPQPNTSVSRSRSWLQLNRLWTGTVPSASKHSNLLQSPPPQLRPRRISLLACRPPCAHRLLPAHASSASARVTPWTFAHVSCPSVTLEILRKSIIISTRSVKVPRVVFSLHMNTLTTTVLPLSR